MASRFRHLLSDKQLAIVAYCAEEVRRQGDTPVHVSHMVRAWEHAWTQSVGRGRPISSEMIQEIGALVAPEVNIGGYRRYGVRVGASIKMPWEAVPRAIETLCESWNDGLVTGMVHDRVGPINPAEEFYLIFEDAVHPFGDGNGRTGKIILNLLGGTLDDPVWPPNFWGSGNP